LSPRAPRLGAGLALCSALASLALCPSAIALGPPGGLDARAFELVSPAEKSGGEVGDPGTAAAGVLQAAAGGGALAFGSEASFGEAQGAAPVSQYLAIRGAAGWSTANMTPPLLSGTYEGDPHLAFSADLDRSILSSGWRCRAAGGEECAAENPPLGPGAPPGYRNLYLREGTAYTPLITAASFPALPAAPEDFHLAFAGASPDLRHVVFSTDEGLYEWSEGELERLSPLPEAMLAAPAGAVSEDGSRVYFSLGEDGPLYLHEPGEVAKLLPETIAGATFQAASADGHLAFFTAGSELYRYDALTEASEPIAAEVSGVLGASAEGTYVYYQSATGLRLWHEGASALIAPGASAAAPANFPPATGSAHLTPDGTRLAFLSTDSLTGYANVDKTEVFLYEAPAKELLCASCNPRGSTPFGPSSIPGAYTPGEGAPPTHKPRALSSDGRRLFFTSADVLLFTDTDGHPDVYEWEARGAGSCAKAAGCLALLSGGRSGEASFLDASADGRDAYFLTDASLLAADTDTGSLDVYDAREGGGFPEPAPRTPCTGDDCQGPPPGPEDPTPGTATYEGPTNPPVRFPTSPCPRCRRPQVRHGHRRCLAKHPRRRAHRHHRGGRGR
jgi:hypothetical protein